MSEKFQVQLILTAEQKAKLQRLAAAKRWSMNTWVVDQIEAAPEVDLQPAHAEDVLGSSGVPGVKQEV